MKVNMFRPAEIMQFHAGADNEGTWRPMRSDQTTVRGLCGATFSTWANETNSARSDVIEACLAHQEGDKVRAA